MILNNEVAKQIASVNDSEIYNTFYLGSQIVPSFIINDGSIIVKNTNYELQITYTMECFLRTLCIFTFSPLWYLKNELKNDNCVDEESALDLISDLKSLNLIFIENNTNGAFVRPTSNLYKMFNIPKKSNLVIPYNMLTHEMSKFDIFYKVMKGSCREINNYIDTYKIRDKVYKPNLITSTTINSEDLSVIDLLDGVDTESDDKIGIDQDSSNSMLIIDEENIKVDKNNIAKITQVEDAIITELREGKTETIELRDYSCLFTDNTKCQSENFLVKYPDLIIPIKRNSDLSPNTIGVEMELTPKAQDHYDNSVRIYKNNLKYGAMIWFVNDFRTKAKIYQALKNIGGSGTCKTIVLDYSVPREYIFR